MGLWYWLKEMFVSPPITDTEAAVELALEIDKFLAGEGGAYDWGDAIDGRQLSDIKNFCWSVNDNYPPHDGLGFASPEGYLVLADLAKALRKSPTTGREFICSINKNTAS